ncbi:MAG TPA: substrate-binding domain-containing protein, partial [Vicinamibacterales bacterium]|nr:substrate-binding domain-containing protein [Vicinamibacterales bacterium]
MKRCAALLFATAVLAAATPSFAQVTVMTSGGFRAAFTQLAPELERTTGITITMVIGASQGPGPDTIGAQLRRGVFADVVIMSREGLEDLIAEGRIAAGTDVNLAQTPLGLSVRAGAPKPDISSVDAVRQTLLGAKSVAFRASTTGIYLTTKLFPRLGISEEMARKSTTAGVAAVASGNAELAIQPVSELLPQAGADFVGTLPVEIQYVSVFSAAVLAGSREPAASGRLIAFLASPQATAAIQRSGMARVDNRVEWPGEGDV